MYGIFKAKLHPEEEKDPTLNIGLGSFAEIILWFQPGLSKGGNLSGWQNSLDILVHFPPPCDNPLMQATHPTLSMGARDSFTLWPRLVLMGKKREKITPWHVAVSPENAAQPSTLVTLFTLSTLVNKRLISQRF